MPFYLKLYVESLVFMEVGVLHRIDVCASMDAVENGVRLVSV